MKTNKLQLIPLILAALMAASFARGAENPALMEPVKSVYDKAYCPMAEASWLQTGKRISNPYMEKEMPTCGEIKRKF